MSTLENPSIITASARRHAPHSGALGHHGAQVHQGPVAAHDQLLVAYGKVLEHWYGPPWKVHAPLLWRSGVIIIIDTYLCTLTCVNLFHISRKRLVREFGLDYESAFTLTSSWPLCSLVHKVPVHAALLVQQNACAGVCFRLHKQSRSARSSRA